MGLFSFFKKAGKKLKGGGDEPPSAEELKKEVEDLGLDTSGLEIKVEGDTVKVEGAAASDEIKEKVILAVGNVDGVAAVEAEADTAVFHTVEKGDTLWAISQDRYGDGFLFVRVFEANREAIRNPDLIYPGQIFTLPE